MPNERTWNSFPNIAFPDFSSALNLAKSSLWLIKAMLTGAVGGATLGLWTVEGSSDAATAGMDAVDRLGVGAFDATKWTRANAGTAHSWFVIGNATLGAHLCFDWSGSFDEYCAVIFSPNAFTGGSTTARPTATLEATHQLSQVQQQHCEATASASKRHLSLATTGEFCLLASKNLSSQFNHMLAVFQLDVEGRTDSYPVVSFNEFNNAASGVFYYVDVAQTGAGAVLRGRRGDGAAVFQGSIIFPAYYFSNLFDRSNLTLASQDQVTGDYGEFPMFAVHVVGDTTSYRKGRIPDCTWGGGKLADGQFDNQAGGNPLRMKAGAAFVPWTSNTAPIL